MDCAVQNCFVICHVSQLYSYHILIAVSIIAASWPYHFLACHSLIYNLCFFIYVSTFIQCIPSIFFIMFVIDFKCVSCFDTAMDFLGLLPRLILIDEVEVRASSS